MAQHSVSTVFVIMLFATPAVSAEIKLRCSGGEFGDDRVGTFSNAMYNPFDITLNPELGTMSATYNFDLKLTKLTVTTAQYIGKGSWNKRTDGTEYRQVVTVDRYDLRATNSFERKNGVIFGSVHYSCAILGSPKI